MKKDIDWNQAWVEAIRRWKIHADISFDGKVYKVGSHEEIGRGIGFSWLKAFADYDAKKGVKS